MATTKTRTIEPQTALKRSANAIRGAHFDAGTEPTAKERALFAAAERVEDIRQTLTRIENDIAQWAANVESASSVGQAISAVRGFGSTDRFRKLQQLADELVGIWCVEDGLR